MAHNPMVEIVLEKALNVLTEVQDVLAQEIVTLQFMIVNIEKNMPVGEECVQYRDRLDKYFKVKESVDKVVRQGNSLDI